MQATLFSPVPTYYYSHVRKQLNSADNSQIVTPTTATKTTKTRRTTILCSYHNKNQTQHKKPLTNNLLLSEETHSFSVDINKKKLHRDISTNMWWSNLKASLGQRFNFEGVASSVSVVTKDSHLALPHLRVPDITWIDWVELKQIGFQGVVFDKDNTLTPPYSLTLWPRLVPSLDHCKSVFGDNVVVFSNSAGLYQYDADGSKARALEEFVGVHVIRHGVKKPAGTAEDIEKYFGCASSLLVMVGDRPFTDIVYGNQNGFLTILTEPFSLEEPFVVKQVRKLEASLLNHWHQRGLKPTDHSLMPEAMQCVKVPQYL